MTPHERSTKARRAAEHRHAVGRLLNLYGHTDSLTRREGRSWYSNGRLAVLRMPRPDELSGDDACGVVAALSPRQRWSVNLRSARMMLGAALQCDPEPRVHFPRENGRAWEIANGAEPSAILGGDKVRAFWRALCGDPAAVTLDIWAMRAALGPDAGWPTSSRRYAQVANWYTSAAVEVGETPRDFQAITWIAVRGSAD